MPAYPLFLWRETGPVEWYVGRATPMCTPTCAARAAPRASSASWTRTEQQDYLELIAWIVKQPWCNGRVGGIGQSYYAMAQWLMAT